MLDQRPQRTGAVRGTPMGGRAMTYPLLFTTGVSGTVLGRRQPPAMPQGVPRRGGAPAAPPSLMNITHTTLIDPATQVHRLPNLGTVIVFLPVRVRVLL